MKKIFLVFAIMLLSSFAYSAYAKDSKENDSELLKEIEKVTSIQADFTQINDIKDFGKDEYSGTLSVVKGYKALWDYKKPNVSWYLFSLKTITFYDGVHNQLMIYENGKHITNILLQLLIDISVAKYKFDIITKGDTLTLTPKVDLGMENIIIKTKKGVISSMESTDNAGNNTKIIFTNVKINEKIPEKVFNKKAPKDAEVFKEKNN